MRRGENQAKQKQKEKRLELGREMKRNVFFFFAFALLPPPPSLRHTYVMLTSSFIHVYVTFSTPYVGANRIEQDDISLIGVSDANGRKPILTVERVRERISFFKNSKKVTVRGKSYLSFLENR